MFGRHLVPGGLPLWGKTPCRAVEARRHCRWRASPFRWGASLLCVPRALMSRSANVARAPRRRRVGAACGSWPGSRMRKFCWDRLVCSGWMPGFDHTTSHRHLARRARAV